ncbi:MAG: 50S ribosomal protein L6 [Candidatus Diapherotrites archaeon]|jgi:large subunit ribosomal protein L6|uniref:50S ribosomal protein L6 n=1 Tax=Candidatus Iainarchaeum sp. TaxID=3101447 RepID=A0A8T5GFX6_9ARCH|nr:50S ribosomal protein L6 [Candidatus Diapherotrites archaeon]MBT7241595.1 50S ribosomal protein L6 [Candidatus Diapherotrites archaeon]
MEKEIVQTITVPDGIKVELINDHTISVSNDKGTLTRTFKSHMLTLSINGQKVTLEGTPVNKKTRALLMTVIAHIKNMIKGLMFGFKYNLKIVYSHFPMTAKVEGSELIITNFIGEKNMRRVVIVGETKVEIKGEDVTVSGINIEEVSQTATNIEQKAKVKGKDIRRYTDGIYLVKKETMEEMPEDFAIEMTRGKVEELDATKTPKTEEKKEVKEETKVEAPKEETPVEKTKVDEVKEEKKEGAE